MCNYEFPATDNISAVDEHTCEVAVIVAPLLKCWLCANSNACNNICNVETAGMVGRRVRNFDRGSFYRGGGYVVLRTDRQTDRQPTEKLFVLLCHRDYLYLCIN
jgi:hypothetical protein